PESMSKNSLPPPNLCCLVLTTCQRQDCVIDGLCDCVPRAKLLDVTGIRMDESPVGIRRILCQPGCQRFTQVKAHNAVVSDGCVRLVAFRRNTSIPVGVWSGVSFNERFSAERVSARGLVIMTVHTKGKGLLRH